MKKDLILTAEALQEMLNTAVAQDRNSLDVKAISIAGCDTLCIFEHSVKIRNDDQGILALKHWCMINDYSSKMVFDIIKNSGLIEIDDNGNRYLTEEGFRQFNGIEPQSSPLVTIANNIVYINDKDDRFDINFLSFIKSDPMFDDNIGYNERIKTKTLKYSRKELEILKRLGIERTTDEA